MVNPMFFLWSARLSGSFWMNLITVTSICLRWVLLLPMTLLSSFSWVMTVKLLMMVEPSLFRVLEALDHWDWGQSSWSNNWAATLLDTLTQHGSTTETSSSSLASQTCCPIPTGTMRTRGLTLMDWSVVWRVVQSRRCSSSTLRLTILQELIPVKISGRRSARWWRRGDWSHSLTVLTKAGHQETWSRMRGVSDTFIVKEWRCLCHNLLERQLRNFYWDSIVSLTRFIFLESWSLRRQNWFSESCDQWYKVSGSCEGAINSDLETNVW